MGKLKSVKYSEMSKRYERLMLERTQQDEVISDIETEIYKVNARWALAQKQRAELTEEIVDIARELASISIGKD